MGASSSNSGNTLPLSWGIGLAAVSLLAIVGGTIAWSQRDEDVAPVTSNEFVQAPDVVGTNRFLPQPPANTIEAGKNNVYSVAQAVENGTPIVKIKVTPSGDEIIVDAATGRVLETRPSRPLGPGPMGRAVAPFHPAT